MTNPTTQRTETGPETLDLDALSALCDSATPGPWEVEEYTAYDGYGVFSDDGGIGTAYVCRDLNQGPSDGSVDATFIAACRSAVPALIAEVLSLRERLALTAVLADEMHDDEDGLIQPGGSRMHRREMQVRAIGDWSAPGVSAASFPVVDEPGVKT